MKTNLLLLVFAIIALPSARADCRIGQQAVPKVVIHKDAAAFKVHAGHPRLFFREADLPVIRQRIEGRFKPEWDGMIDHLQRRVLSQPPAKFAQGSYLKGWELARGLGGRRTSMVGVCFMGLGNPILDRKVYHLQEFLRRHQLRSLLEMRMRDVQQEIRAIEDFKRIHVDGIVLIHSELDAELSQRLFEGMAAVHVDPHAPQDNTASVSVDRHRAMRLLMEHLLRLGHESFALLGFGKNDPWRWPALVETVQTHGLNPAKAISAIETMPDVDSPIEAGGLMTETVLKRTKRPTALIAVDDRTALGAVQALKHAGIEVPRQMSVTGFDNLDLARKLHPTLTSVEQNPLRLMERAGAMLLEQLEAAPKMRIAPRSETVAPELVVGESTGPAWRG